MPPPITTGLVLELEGDGTFRQTPGGADCTEDFQDAQQWVNAATSSVGNAEATVDPPRFIKDAAGPGLHGVYFDGFNDRLQVLDSVDLRPGTGEFNVFVAYQQSSPANSALRTLISKGNSSSNMPGYQILLGTSGQTYYRCHDDAADRAGQQRAGDNRAGGVAHMQLTGSSIFGLMDDSAEGITNGGAGPTENTYTGPITNTDPFYVGYLPATTDQFFLGTIFAVLVYKGAMSLEDRSTVSQYLQDKYMAANYRSDPFVSGTDATIVRIPDICACSDGTILCACEARAAQADDADIDITVKRSTDQGITWSAPVLTLSDGTKIVSKPNLLVGNNGRVHLIFAVATDNEADYANGTAQDDKRLYHMYSDDNGATWQPTPTWSGDGTDPAEITQQVFPGGFNRFYGVGPAAGVRLLDGTLFFPMGLTDNSATPPKYGSFFYSKDNGATWQKGPDGPSDSVNETAAALTANGSVFLSIRDQDNGDRRLVTTIPRNLADYPAVAAEPQLPCPKNAASMKSISGTLIHVNTDETGNSGTRRDIKLKVSTDNGATWDTRMSIQPGSSAYTATTYDKDYVYVAMEVGSTYAAIRLARYSRQIVPITSIAYQPLIAVMQ